MEHSQQTQVLSSICQIVAQRLQVDISQVESSSYLKDDLGANSIDMIEIIMDIESTFGVRISDAEAENIHQIKDLCPLCIKVA